MRARSEVYSARGQAATCLQSLCAWGGASRLREWSHQYPELKSRRAALSALAPVVQAPSVTREQLDQAAEALPVLRTWEVEQHPLPGESLRDQRVFSGEGWTWTLAVDPATLPVTPPVLSALRVAGECITPPGHPGARAGRLALAWVRVFDLGGLNGWGVDEVQTDLPTARRPGHVASLVRCMDTLTRRGVPAWAAEQALYALEPYTAHALADALGLVLERRGPDRCVGVVDAATKRAVVPAAPDRPYNRTPRKLGWPAVPMREPWLAASACRTLPGGPTWRRPLRCLLD